MKKVRVGLIGIGAQGGAYAAFLTGKPGFGGIIAEKPEHMELGALCDIDSEVEKKCAKEFPEAAFYGDYKEMIESGKIDAIITTVPHYLHTEMAIYALSKGIHVLGEKPAGVYTKQVKEMNDYADTKPNLVFGIMFNQRTNKLYQKIKEIVDSKELGEIRRTNWIINSWWRPQTYYDQSSWRATWGGEGGGVLVNQAPHQLDLWQWICGMPKKVCANVKYGSHRDIGVENDVTAVVDYGNGATGTFITCTHDPIGTDRFEIDFDNGKIVVEDSKKATIYRLTKSEKEMNETMSMMDVAMLVQGRGEGKLFDEEVIENIDGWGVQHVTVMEDFAKAIVYGTPLLAPGSEGIKGVELANAILLSGWLGKEVEIPVDQELYLDELNKRIEEEGKFPTRG